MIKRKQQKMTDKLAEINKNQRPNHIAIIMDGNGRWALQQKENRNFGHQQGAITVRNIVETSAEIGIKYLTLYAFSTENWHRPATEVDALMNLLVQSLDQERSTLMDNNIRLLMIGDINRLSDHIQDKLKEIIHLTAQNNRTTLVLAISYSARWEIQNAIKNIIHQGIPADKINDDLISNYLTTAGIPDPDLLIRTSGEQRISNFLLWQIAYTELYFTSKLWPEFTREDFLDAILDYQKRQRRFGKTEEQILNEDIDSSK